MLAAAVEAGVDRLFRVGRGPGDRRAGVRHAPRSRGSTRSSGRATVTWPRPRRSCARDCAIDFYAGPSEIVIVSNEAPSAWIAADMIAQAEHDAGGARDLHHDAGRPSHAACCGAIEERMPAEGPARESLAARGAIVVARIARGGDRDCRPADPRAPRVRRRRGDRRACGRARPSSGRGARRPRATTRPARTTSCRRPARRVSGAGCRRRTSCACRACSA